ncbi:MAG TPA: translocation/assembly module TamB domain-containing protein [Burkholderiaceae bacterium]|nr:translocation/assembly module TamB domain-containing protein [Burkholderiaceae bacterium]
MAARAPGPLRLLARVVGIVLAALLLAVTVALWWVGQTTAFVDFALARAAAASGGALQAGAARGTLLGGVRVESLRWRDDARDVELRGVSVAWRPAALLRRELHFVRIEVASASVRLRESGAALALPPSLALPLNVTVDALGLGRLQVASSGAAALDVERVGFSGRYRSGTYRIDHLSASSAQWGEARLQGRLGDSAPFALELTGRVAARIAGRETLPRIRVLADGTLEDFAVAAQALPPDAAAGAEADARPPGPVWIGLDTRVRPFAVSAAQRVAPIDVTLDGVDPAQLGFADAPRARVSGSATIRVGEGRIAGRLALRNALPGAANRQALPLVSIDTDFVASDTQLEFSGLRATLAGNGTIAGAASIDLARRLTLFGRSLLAVKSTLALRGVDLSQLASGLDPTRLAGTVSVDGPAFELDLADAARHGIAATALARVEAGRLRIERARLDTPAGSVSTRGTVALAAPWTIDVDGAFGDLDPAGVFALRSVLGARAARWGDDLPPQWTSRLRGRLTGTWAAQGVAWPDPLLQTRVAIDRSVLDGEPLRASWQGEVSRARIAQAALALAYGDLQADARGSLGAAGDRLRFSLRAGALSRIDPRAEGSATANGELTGGWSGTAGLGVVADVEGKRLRWAGDTLRADALTGRIEWPDLRAGRVAVRVDAEALRVAGRVFERASARVDGDVDAHTLRLDLSGPQAAARAAAHGALLRTGSGDWRWSASLDELVAEAPVPVRLKSPATLSVDAHQVALGEAALEVDGGAVRIARLGWRDGALDTQGEASGLPVARWAERFAGAQALPGGARLEDLRLRGSWDLAGTSLRSPSGRLAFRLDAEGAAESRGEAELRLDQGRIDGSVDVRVPTLAFANRMIGPEWAVAGRLHFAGTVGGTVERPRLQGALDGRDLALMQRALGWRLSNGTLAARFDGDRLDLESLRLESGSGSITMSGQLLLDGMHGGFTLRADRLPVPIGPGQRVVLSGDTGIASSGTSFEWKGDIRADEGLIELRGGDAPSLPDDVVIVDHTAPGEGPQDARDSASSGFRIGADLDLDLGDKLRVRGSGVDVVLAGTLNLRGTLPAAPRAFGTVRVRSGTYTAYGQRLEIERGQVVFNGPLDNPVLDIVAMRRNQLVEAGVALTGTVLSPRLRLVSSPEVPDSQKLSWLVLGVGLDEVRTAGQGAALQAAAATLFGSNDGGLSAGLAGALGLDVLTVRGAAAGGVFDPNFGAAFPGQATTGGAPVGTATQNVVAIGKRLSSRVFVTYEQGLRGVWNLLRIQYDITNRLSVRAQAGTDSAVDMLYFYSFD